MFNFLESTTIDWSSPTLWIVVIIILLILFIATCLKVVLQAEAYIIERFGAYQETWSVGLHLKWPFIERIALRVLLKEQVVDFPPQPVITKDNVTMQIDTVVYFQITDPKLFAYGVQNPMMAIENLTATTLRNIIGDLELDATLTSREIINGKMRVSLDEATDPWGIKVNRVELKRSPRSLLQKVRSSPPSSKPRPRRKQPSFARKQRRKLRSARQKVRQKLSFAYRRPTPTVSAS